MLSNTASFALFRKFTSSTKAAGYLAAESWIIFLLCLAIGRHTAYSQLNIQLGKPVTPSIEVSDYEQYVSYWTLEPNWHSELQLRNTSPTTDLLVSPSLRATDGSETPLSAVLVHPNEVVDVNLHEAVMYSAKQPSSLLGSVVLRYKAETQGILYAAMMVHRESRPIAFHIDAMGKFTEDKDYLREGVWWLPNDKVSDYLVLTNQGDDRMPLVLSIFDAQGHAYQKELTLLPRETNRLSVRDLTQAGHLNGDFGGIQVHALAHARALDTLHILFDEKAGFSATLKMFDHDPNALVSERDFAKKGSWTIRAPMLALAQPDPALLLPAFTELEPRLLLRNTTQNPVVANIIFNWRSSASMGKTQGPTIRLKALETRMIKLSDLPSSEAPPSGAHWATVSIATDGPPDGVVAVAASYNTALTYGAQSPFSDQLSSFWKGGEWLADANHDSIITVGNASLKPMKARFSLLYSHGTSHYDLEQALAPDEQMWVDVGEIIRTGKPDMNGAVLPKDLASGSYQFQDLTNKAVGALYEGKVIYDVSSGHVTYGCAVNCCNRSVYLNYNPLSVAITLTFTNGVSGDDTCGDDGANLSGDFWNWSTVNPSIATTTKGGTHTGMALGSTTSSTYGQVERPNGRFGCINFTPEPTGPTNVLQVSVSPPSIVMSSGDTSVALNVSVTPSSAASLEAVSFGTLSNPNSASQASLSFTKPANLTGNDAWKIGASGNNSPSTISNASACASTACSSSSSAISIPPQVLIQVLYGEAHGQAVSGDSVSEPAIAGSIKDRLNNSGFGSPATWQAAITSSQFNGIATQITTGQQPELTVANAAYNLSAPDITGGSPCFFTPDAAGFAAIQNAYNTSTSTVPTVNFDPKCYGSNRQFVWKTSIGNNVALPGVPAFIFERQKVGSAAVVQIP